MQELPVKEKKDIGKTSPFEDDLMNISRLWSGLDAMSNCHKLVMSRSMWYT